MLLLLKYWILVKSVLIPQMVKIYIKRRNHYAISNIQFPNQSIHLGIFTLKINVYSSITYICYTNDLHIYRLSQKKYHFLHISPSRRSKLVSFNFTESWCESVMNSLKWMAWNNMVKFWAEKKQNISSKRESCGWCMVILDER